MRKGKINLTFVCAMTLALVTAVASRGDTTEAPPAVPGFEAIWPALTAEEQTELSNALKTEIVDPAAVENSLSGVPEGPTQAEIEAAEAEGPLTTGPDEGLFNDRQQSPFPEVLITNNQWVDLADDGSTLRQVYAGALRADPTQGLLVFTEVPWPPENAEDVSGATGLELISSDGPLRITSVSGETLVIETTAAPHVRLVFDLDSRVLDHPPECALVAPDRTALWPPTRNYQTVTLGGGTDADGDALTYAITGVSQDEPVTGTDLIDVSPDAELGPGATQVKLRAERTVLGDGRVYRVTYTISDGRGGKCSGTISVGVPLLPTGPAAVDSAPPSYNSLG